MSSEFTEIHACPSSSPGLSRASRGARLPSFLGLPADLDLDALLALLDGLDVLVIGTGSVGAPLALHLSRLGIGVLRLVDRGRFKDLSLQTQPILPSSVGKPKASAIGEDCKRISPDTRVLVFDGDFESIRLADLADVRMAFLATDNLHAEVVAGERLLELGIPLVQASVHGGSLVAQVRFFGNAGSSSPCPACAFGPGEMAQLGKEASFSCEGAAPPASVPRIHADPTMSVSPLCSLAADLAVLQALKHFFRLGPPPADSVLEFCATSGKTCISALRGNPACPCEHVRYERRCLPGPLAAFSPSRISEACGLPPDAGSPGPSLAVDGCVFVESGACKCPASVPVRSFVPAGAGSVGSCTVCGSPVYPAPFFTHRALSGSLFCALRDRTLASLGVPASASAAVLRFGASGAFFLSCGCGKESA